jgi:hypothetical protein
MSDPGKIERMAARVAFTVLTAKTRPDDLFAGTFFDIREKAKSFKDTQSEKAKNYLSNTLIKDLKSRGAVVAVSDFKLSLGQYRGSKFVTSAKFKVKLKNKTAANDLLKYLQTRYSPKYKMKDVSEPEKDGSVVASFNIR